MSKSVLMIGSYGPSLLNFRGPLIKEMIARGHHVSVAAPEISLQSRDTLMSMGVDVYETPLARTGLNPVQDLAYFQALNRLVKQVSPDFVLTYTIKPNIWGAFAAGLNKVPSAAMVTGLGFAFTQAHTLKRRIIRRLAATLYRMATACNRVVIFQNPDDQADFVAAGCLRDTSKLRMVNGSGVDTAYYAPTPLPQEPVFLMISRLLGNKGVREYGQAAVQVKAAHPEARFLLVGYMDEGPDGIAQTELDGWIAGGVDYIGPQSDVRPALAQSNVYVLPSYREGTPRSVLEAMSMGRAVLTTDAPGCRETCQNGVNGFLVPVGDAKALADKMVWMITHPQERVTMGQASLQIAQDKYDVHKVNATLLGYLGL